MPATTIAPEMRIPVAVYPPPLTEGMLSYNGGGE